MYFIDGVLLLVSGGLIVFREMFLEIRVFMEMFVFVVFLVMLFNVVCFVLIFFRIDDCVDKFLEE